jgi:hypothetical protein
VPAWRGRSKCVRVPAATVVAVNWFPTIEDMTIQRMDHVGIVVDDLAAATEFFVQLGLELRGEGSVEGRWVDRIVGLESVRTDLRSCKRRTATDDSS